MEQNEMQESDERTFTIKIKLHSSDSTPTLLQNFTSVQSVASLQLSRELRVFASSCRFNSGKEELTPFMDLQDESMDMENIAAITDSHSSTSESSTLIP